MVHTTTIRTKPSLMSRLTGRHHRRTRATHHSATPVIETHHNTHHNHHNNHHGYNNSSTVAPVHHQRRRPSIGDKVSGAMLKLKGSLTHRPGVKAAGTRRMHGTDGRGSHRTYGY